MAKKELPEIGTAPEGVCQVEDDPGLLFTVSGTTPAAAGVSHCPYIWDEPLPLWLIARIRAYGMAIIRDPNSVDDVEQEVKEKLLNMPRPMWDAIPDKVPYVLAIARYVSRDWLRKELTLKFKHRSFMDTQQQKIEGPPIDLADAACAVGDLMRLLEPFGQECAEAFVRVRFYRHPATNVAIMMNIPVSRVRAHVERVELHVMELLDEQPERLSIKSRIVNLLKRRE